MLKPGEFHTKIVGVTKENEDDEEIQDLLEDMSECCCDGTPLSLEHEPDNPHDENAIKVYHEFDHIGYIKADLAKDLASLVDQQRVEAEICEITGGEYGKSYGCNILIRIVPEGEIAHTDVRGYAKVAHLFRSTPSTYAAPKPFTAPKHEDHPKPYVTPPAAAMPPELEKPAGAEKAGAIRIWKLVSGIISIVLCGLVVFQSFAAGIYNTLTSNGQVSGSAGVVVAIMLLSGGIVSIVTMKGHPVGDAALLILYGIAAITGYSFAGAYSDLVIWSTWCLICFFFAVVSMVKGRPGESDAAWGEKVKRVLPVLYISHCAMIAFMTVFLLSLIFK